MWGQFLGSSLILCGTSTSPQLGFATEPQLIVARYQQGKHLAIELFAGDVFDVAADAMIFGRTKSIREAIESKAPRFQPVPRHTALQYALPPRRNLLRTKSKRLPWQFAYSLQYRPCHAGATSLHVQRLAFNIYQTLLCYVIQDAPAKHVVIVPFSCRNPETLAHATIGGLLHIYPSLVPTPTRYTIAALDNLDAFERLLDDPDRIRAALTAWTIHPPSQKRIARAFKRLPVPPPTSNPR